MLKKIEVKIDATCEVCVNFKNKTLLPSDGHVCELDGVCVQPTSIVTGKQIGRAHV